MIKQEMFIEEKKPFFPASLIPWKQQRPFETIRPISEVVVLQQTDQLATLSFEQKAAAFVTATSAAYNKKLNKPCFVHKISQDLETLPFDELFLTQNVKTDRDECVYAKDGAGRPVCFIIQAFKIKNFLNNYDMKEKQVYSVLDPFSTHALSFEQVKARYKNHPRFQQFMELKGWEGNRSYD